MWRERSRWRTTSTLSSHTWNRCCCRCPAKMSTKYQTTSWSMAGWWFKWWFGWYKVSRTRIIPVSIIVAVFFRVICLWNIRRWGLPHLERAIWPSERVWRVRVRACDYFERRRDGEQGERAKYEGKLVVGALLVCRHTECCVGSQWVSRAFISINRSKMTEEHTPALWLNAGTVPIIDTLKYTCACCAGPLWMRWETEDTPISCPFFYTLCAEKLRNKPLV